MVGGGGQDKLVVYGCMVGGGVVWLGGGVDPGGWGVEPNMVNTEQRAKKKTWPTGCSRGV